MINLKSKVVWKCVSLNYILLWSSIIWGYFWRPCWEAALFMKSDQWRIDSALLVWKRIDIIKTPITRNRIGSETSSDTTVLTSGSAPVHHFTCRLCYVCYWCGKYGHYAQTCKHKEAVCNSVRPNYQPALIVNQSIFCKNKKLPHKFELVFWTILTLLQVLIIKESFTT